LSRWVRGWNWTPGSGRESKFFIAALVGGGDVTQVPRGNPEDFVLFNWRAGKPAENLRRVGGFLREQNADCVTAYTPEDRFL